MNAPTDGEVLAGCGCLVLVVSLVTLVFGIATAIGYALANGLFG